MVLMISGKGEDAGALVGSGSVSEFPETRRVRFLIMNKLGYGLRKHIAK
jgi:hypothetical protein